MRLSESRRFHATLALLSLLACGSSPGPAPEAAPGVAPEPAPETAPAPDAPTTSLSHETEAGTLTIHPVRHGTLYLTLGEQVIWLDPVGELGAYPKGQAVLVTDIHPDHLDAAALSAVRADGAVAVGPQAVADQLGEQGSLDTVLANGETTEVLGIQVTAVPMYNHHRGPEEGKLFHDKGRGNGYLLEVGGKRVYFAGDTACTDEMKALTGIDHAFVPMNLPYTMPPEEAAECVAAFKPAVVTPYHYNDSDLSVFDKGLEGSGVEVRRAEFYPPEPVPPAAEDAE